MQYYSYLYKLLKYHYNSTIKMYIACYKLLYYIFVYVRIKKKPQQLHIKAMHYIIMHKNEISYIVYQMKNRKASANTCADILYANSIFHRLLSPILIEK